MAALQWRRKTATAQEGLAQVRQVAALCRELGLTCIVNDDWRLAALIDADGVHLGREDGSLAQARLALGSEKIIGVSCYDEPALAAQALKADVDYIAFGAMYQIGRAHVRTPGTKAHTVCRLLTVKKKTYNN